MKNSSSFRPEPVALSLQVMYRMGGLRNALVYLLDITRPMMPVTRINTIFAYSDASTVISVADTSTVSVSNKYSGGGRSRPLILSARTGETLIIGDLSAYQHDPEVLREPSWRDMPYLHYR